MNDAAAVGAYDVAVIGGGPAGSAAAITLAQAGARVALIEARTYPFDKLCGEFLSPECAGLLAELGVLAGLQALGPALIRHVRVTAPRAGASWLGALPGAGWGLSRRALDAALAEHAGKQGAEVRTGTTVTGLAGSLAEGFELQAGTGSGRRPLRLRARVVIGAHGKRSALDRALGRRFWHQPQPFMALKRHHTGLPLPGRIELHAFPGGYCGMSELERAAEPGRSGARLSDVCLLVHAEAFRAVAGGGGAPAFVRWLRGASPALAERLGPAEPAGERWLSISQVGFAPRAPVEAGVLMAGDAAGLIAPVAGDGIGMALRAGLLAAEHSLRFLAGRATAGELQRGYARAWRREFGLRLALSRGLHRLLLRPALLGPGLWLLGRLPALGRYLVTRTRGPLAPAPEELV